MTIAVVGGGAAGTLCAIALLRHRSGQPRRVVVLEPSAQLGAGVAYGTGSAEHLLNVRAAGMSALPDAPRDFVTWAHGRGMDVSGPEFLPRRLYGPYLRDTLASVEVRAAPGVTVEHRLGRVVDVRPIPKAAGWRVALEKGESLVADHVVLATGHALAPWLGEHPRVVLDPWAPGQVRALCDAAAVLIVGTGLTAIDVTLLLREAGHRGMVHLISSHGLLPEAHLHRVLPPRPPAVLPGGDAAASARAILRALRADAATAEDWRQTVDAMRPVTVELWRRLALAEQRRAMRHLARRWEVRRHRMAPQIAAQIDSLRAEGRLTVGRGRVVRVDLVGALLRATISDRGVRRTHDADGVVLCSGQSADPRHDSLLGGLVGSGVAAVHSLGFGLDVEHDGRVRTGSGSAWPKLWAVGTLRKGAEWESTAVPELRAHAHDLAASILGAA